MSIIFMVIFTGIALTVLFKIAHLIYLLFKLGFNFEVIKFLAVLGVMTAFAAFILIGTDFSTAGFVIASIIGGALLPYLFDITKMKPKSHYGTAKPNSVSGSSYAWSYYGGGNVDCGNVGFSSGSSASFNSDSGGDCSGGGGGSE
ncbi:hypothetical protein [Psychrobacillus antarcticus]|uniref:hypothetical protein n=1 Tax=Psychrobacillus antarcticus TaxID=2879115 RepID=UPI0024077E86|nr:hypothetical protein [Psychrobacillus antarcticus]